MFRHHPFRAAQGKVTGGVQDPLGLSRIAGDMPCRCQLFLYEMLRRMGTSTMPNEIRSLRLGRLDVVEGGWEHLATPGVEPAATTVEAVG